MNIVAEQSSIHFQVEVRMKLREFVQRSLSSLPFDLNNSPEKTAPESDIANLSLKELCREHTTTRRAIQRIRRDQENAVRQQSLWLERVKSYERTNRSQAMHCVRNLQYWEKQERKLKLRARRWQRLERDINQELRLRAQELQRQEAQTGWLIATIQTQPMLADPSI